jgi:hypothetical protein
MRRCCSDRRRLGFGREITGGAACSPAPTWACGVCCIVVLHGVLVRRTRAGERWLIRRRSACPGEPFARLELVRQNTKRGRLRHVPVMTHFVSPGDNLRPRSASRVGIRGGCRTNGGGVQRVYAGRRSHSRTETATRSRGERRPASRALYDPLMRRSRAGKHRRSTCRHAGAPHQRTNPQNPPHTRDPGLDVPTNLGSRGLSVRDFGHATAAEALERGGGRADRRDARSPHRRARVHGSGGGGMYCGA